MPVTSAELAPEVLFHRFFQNRPGLQKQGYRGKVDLVGAASRLPMPGTFLGSLQDALNAALANENTCIAEHVDHGTFHFDYVDSDEANALAFCSGGYSFIGATVPLLLKLWDSSVHVSRSTPVAAAFGGHAHGGGLTAEERIQVVCFRLQLFFIALHEYTHVVHGHVAMQVSTTGAAGEITGAGQGSLECQAREADADGYAVYFMLANIIDSPEERANLLDVMGQTAQPAVVQDRLLLSSFVVAVTAFFLLRNPEELCESDAYDMTHPPAAARMSFVMKAVHAWCLQKRPKLAGWMTPGRFQQLINDVPTVLLGMTGALNWSGQIAFLRTDAGRRYFQSLDEALVREVQAFGRP